MDKKSLAHYLEFQTNWNELSRIPESHLAAVALLQYAVTDVNALRKIYLCQDHDLTGEKATDSAINTHRFVILRSWSSRIFEAIQFLKSGQRKDFCNEPKLKELADEAMGKLYEISQGDGYETARTIRNEATNHYSFSAAKKNLKHVDASMNVNMYIAENCGNQFYPMGEAVMFHALLNRRWSDQTEQQRTQRFHDWLFWNLDANKWLSDVLGRFVQEIMFNSLGRSSIRKTTYWVSPDYASDRSGKLTPIFVQRRKNHEL